MSYPRGIGFPDHFPLTSTGNIRRNHLHLRDPERRHPIE
jgi:hypothetical protein